LIELEFGRGPGVVTELRHAAGRARHGPTSTSNAMPSSREWA